MASEIVYRIDLKEEIPCLDLPDELQGKFIEFWQKNRTRLKELTGVSQSEMLPMYGNPGTTVEGWLSVKKALLLAAKTNSHHRDWICGVCSKIDDRLERWNTYKGLD